MNTAKRAVVTRSPIRTVGLLNCPWFQPEPIEHESRLEKHFVSRAILFGPLTAVEHQPFTLTLAGIKRSYTPDFLLRFTNGASIVVEVKRSERIKELRGRFDEIAQRLGERDMPFFVLHEGQIESAGRAVAARLLRRYAMLTMAGPAAEAVVQAVTEHPKGLAIKRLVVGQRATMQQIYHLIARRRISVGANLSVGENDLVYPAQKEITHAAHQFGSWFGGAPWRSHP